MENPIENKKEMLQIYDLPAPYAGRIYLTNVNGLFRLCFCEVIPDVNEMMPRCAVTMTPSDLFSMVALLNEVVKNLMDQQQTPAPKKEVDLEDLVTKATVN